MARSYDHSKKTLGEACGFKEEDTVIYKEVLLQQFQKNANEPSKIVEVLERDFDPRVLSMLLVGSILATRRLEGVMQLMESLGGAEAYAKLMSLDLTDKEETEIIG